MSVMTWARTRSEAMTLWDIGVLKIYCALLGIVVGAYAAPFVLRNVTWFVVPLVALSAWGGYRWLTAQPRRHA